MQVKRRGMGRNRWGGMEIKNRRLSPMIAISVLALWLLYYSYAIVDGNLKPTVIAMATTLAHQIATEAIHKTMYEKILPNINYEDLTSVHKDAQNHVTFIQANSIEISKIVTHAGSAIKAALKDLPRVSLKVPLGQVTGLSLLANRGPELEVKLTPMGSLDIRIRDHFEQAGINQVKHTIYLEIKTKVRIVVPLLDEEEPIEMKIPIAESIIVGPVPQTYFGGGIPLESVGNTLP